MAEKALLQIKDAEARAQALIENAREEAAQILKRAEEETAAAFLQLSETGRQQASEKRQQAETYAHANSLEFSKETAELCAALKQKLLKQKARAINAVIQSIKT